jgi:site-specific DNA-adenine methylase
MSKMFSYYGRKSKVIKYYPIPRYNTIIEPFAGSAVYSLYKDNWQRNVILLDRYEVITRIWKYLQSASSQDILKLPSVANGEELIKVNGFSELLQEEKWLIGFSVNNASVMPKNFAGQMNFNSWHRDQPRIAKDLFKIKHWKILSGSYQELDNQEATWYIDPPYQFGGKYYKHSAIDYYHLASWSIDRKGQVIVCENTKATWLPFKPLKKMQGQLHTTTEAIYMQVTKEQIE